MRLPRARYFGPWSVMTVSLAMVAVTAAGADDGRTPSAVAQLPPDGAQVFRTYCASCHGVNATGGGPAAVAMKVVPPDLTQIALRNKGVFPAERVRQIVLGTGPAAHGERTMPVWGDVFARRVAGSTPAAVVDALVRHLDGIQQRPAE